MNPYFDFKTIPFTHSYLILAPGPMQAEKDLKKSAGLCLDSTGLDPETYRLGHTKVTLYFNYYL